MRRKIEQGRVNWGIIGVGDVCEIKSAPAMNLVKDSRIEAVMRRDAAKARGYAERHGIAKWYSDADALIHDPAVNAIYIATPPLAHYEYCVKAADAGKPVYTEKPMARSYQDCIGMIEACKRAGVPLYCAYYRRALPNFVQIKRLLDEGRIGDVRSVEIRMRKSFAPDIVATAESNWRTDPDIAGGGYFYDLASHQLDLLDYLFGPIKSACGYAANQARQYQAEDIVNAAFSFSSGILGTGNWCFTTSAVSDCDKTTIVGSLGEISFATFDNSELVLRNANGAEEKFSHIMPKHIQQPLIQQVVDDLLGRGECVSTGRSAARTNQVMEWMTRARV